MPKNNLLTVSEVAQKVGVSADTIRRWDKARLIKAHRSPQNYRLFNLDEVKRYTQKINGENISDYKILKSNQYKDKYTLVDLFTGAGGTALGLENAGLKHVLAVEIDKNAVSTLKTNRPTWNVLEADVKNVDFSKYEADIIEGGFPCQSFSYAGKSLGFGDIRGTLFFEFARAVKEIEPKIAIGENVRGLLTHDKGRTLKTMVKKLENLGYRVKYKVLRSQYLDVPQKRERLIILAIRKDLNIPFLFPKEKNYIVTLKEALKDVPKSNGQVYPKRKKEILDMVPPGGYWKHLPEDIQKEYMKKSYYLGGGKTGMARRLSWDEPSLTLTCAPAQKQTERCHPKETRPLNIREYARIQTFPDNWQFSGSTSAQYKQIGNAVPVNLGYHIGRCVIAMLENKPDYETMIEIKDEKENTLFNI